MLSRLTKTMKCRRRDQFTFSRAPGDSVVGKCKSEECVDSGYILGSSFVISSGHMRHIKTRRIDTKIEKLFV